MVLPPRPRDIALNGLNPCTLWTADQLRELKVQPAPVSGGPQETASGYPVCTHFGDGNEPDVGYSVTTVLDRDAEVLESGMVESTIVAVDGFPAVQETSESSDISPCRLAVSTAAGQHLRVMAVTRGELSVEQACEMTLRAATFAVQTLQTLR